MAKTSAVFLGSVAVATVCAHKFWPKGFIYGEKEDWEKEKSFERKKRAVKEELDKLEGRAAGGEGRGGLGVGVGRSRSQSQSTTSTSTGRREVVYRDRDYDRDRLGYNGESIPVITSSGRGGNGTMARYEQEAVVYRQDRGTNGRNPVVVVQREQELEDKVVYRGREDREPNRSRSQNAPRLALPPDDETEMVYKRSTREANYDEDYLPPSARNGHTTNGHGHIRSRSAHANGLPARPPSPTTTTMAVAGSPVTATDIRRQQLQIQQREKRDQPRDEYYLLPAPPSSQRPLPLGRSNSFSTPTSTTRDRDRDRENDRYHETSAKYYYQDEALLPVTSRRGGGHGRVTERDRDRDRETVYVYRDRGRDRNESDVRVVDTYYDYNYR